MKKQYETPEMEIVALEQTDIITASGPLNGFATTNGTNHGTNQGKLDSWS